MARRTLVPEAEIVDRLREIPRWSREGDAITRTWKFKDFPAALRFINQVGDLAESMNHHPDIYNSWATVRLTLARTTSAASRTSTSSSRRRSTTSKRGRG